MDAAMELAQAFLVDSPERVTELLSLASGPDQVTLRRAAHSLKGSAALFGATQLEEAAARLEDSAAQEQREPQAAEARRIQLLYEETRGAMEELLSEIAVH
jgi:HPt (histidine-containing phosphotransfer) domain-containing protein